MDIPYQEIHTPTRSFDLLTEQAPQQSSPPQAPPQKTALYDEHEKLGVRFVDFFGWSMPLTYAGQVQEHEAVRTKVGIFDVSHMGQVFIEGKDAKAFINYLVPGDFNSVPLGSSKYTTLCNDEGGIIDDLIITALSDTHFFAVINSARRDVDVQWMTEQAEKFDGEVEVRDVSDKLSMIAIQGPQAIEKLIELDIVAEDFKSLPAFLFCISEDLDGESYFVSKTGYTGEEGIELLCKNEHAAQWWRLLIENEFEPCGLAARDSLRLEAGYSLYGQDLNEQTTPVEAGLSWTVGWKKSADYIGRTVLDQQKRDGVTRKLISFVSESKRPIRAGDQIQFQGQVIGAVTSGGYSPILKCGIGLGYISDPSKANETEGWAVVSRGTELPVRLEKTPFVSTSLRPKK